jgi:hypothetical protein
MGDGFQTQTFPTSAGTTTRLAPIAVWMSARRSVEVGSAYKVERGDGEDETFKRSVFSSAASSGRLPFVKGMTHFQTPCEFLGG